MPNDPQPLLASAYWDYSRKAVISQTVPAPFVLSEQEHVQIANMQQCYQAVPWLFRSVEMRANSVAKMPFRITQKGSKSKDAIDESADYQNAVGFLPNPVDFLWRLEAAASIWGAGYYWHSYNRVRTLGLRYLIPVTVQPEIDDETGLTGFTRWVNGQPRLASTRDIVHFWRPDPFVEIGPPEGSPVKAALAAAGVLLNVDLFAATFFQRGAIKATLLTVEGNPPKTEREALKTWWERIVSGIRNAFSTEVISSSVKPVQIGEGINDLANTTLTEEKKADIAVAMGVPQSVIFSGSATGLGGGGVVRQDDKHFYDKTILPDCGWIQATLNDQVMHPNGYHWEFLPETLDIYQVEESALARSFQLYVDIGLPKSLAAQMVGIELPPGWDYADLDKLEAPKETTNAADEERRKEEQAERDKERAGKPLLPAAEGKALNGDLAAQPAAPSVEQAQVEASKDEDEDDDEEAAAKGGPGSGNFGHEGRPGVVGGSLPSGKANALSPSMSIEEMTAFLQNEIETVTTPVYDMQPGWGFMSPRGQAIAAAPGVSILHGSWAGGMDGLEVLFNAGFVRYRLTPKRLALEFRSLSSTLRSEIGDFLSIRPGMAVDFETGRTDGEREEFERYLGAKAKIVTGLSVTPFETDMRAWRLKSKRKGKVAPFTSDAIPAQITDAVKFLGQDDWQRGFAWLAELQALKANRAPDRAAEAALRDEITALLLDWRLRFAEAIFNGDAVAYDALADELRLLIGPYLVLSVLDSYMAQAALMGVAYDITLVNIAALRWANLYSYELIKGINATTQKLVSEAISQFIATPGMTIGDIERMLERSFGPVRAEMIAVTETTRAYSQGTTVLQDLLRQSGVDMVRAWKTGADEKVCPVCAPLEGKTEDEWPDDLKDGPPAHVKCRCGATLRLRKPAKSAVDWAWPFSMSRWATADDLAALGVTIKGGPGSGNWGHAGRPGMRGGSQPGGGLRNRTAAAEKPPAPTNKVKIVPMWEEEEEAVQAFGLTMDDIAAMTAWPGDETDIQAIVNVAAGKGYVELSVRWVQEGRVEAVGVMERNFKVNDGGSKSAEQSLLEIHKDFQGRDVADKLYNTQFDIYRRIGVSKVDIYADISIGRYAWAQRGFQYRSAAGGERATERFKTWCDDRGVKLNSYPTFRTPQDVANFKASGVKMSHRDIGNPDIKPGDYDLGKAFLLDLSPFGHGAWHGVLDI